MTHLYTLEAVTEAITNGLKHVSVRDEFSMRPDVAVEWHVLDKTDVHCLMARHFHEIRDFVIIFSSHDDHVHLQPN